MITTYLLENCNHCKDLLKYIKKNPNLNICVIIVSRQDISSIKENEPRIKQFPVAFTGNPKKNGLPYKNSHIICGSSTIIDTFKNNFGSNNKNLKGSNISIDYLNDNQGNISSLNNIRKHRNNCFGSNCHIMDRPYGPTDNQFILQGYQTSCATPIRSDLPIRNNFGTTPGTKAWQLERKPWPLSKNLVDGRNLQQILNGNKHAKMNVPSTYSNDFLNQKIYNPLSKDLGNNYGKNNSLTKAPVNDTAPFLTYAAGGNGFSHITGKNYLREQNPISKSPPTSYISGDIKSYVSKNSKNQKLLSQGLNSPWSINAQGINSYGKNQNLKKLNFQTSNIIPSLPIPSENSLTEQNNKPFGNNNPWILTRTVAGSDINPDQYFKRNRFPNNGNGYGKSIKSTKSNSSTKLKSSITSSLNPKSKKKMKFTSPLGIEISFN